MFNNMSMVHCWYLTTRQVLFTESLTKVNKAKLKY
jgi:hypothetical protein